jgi:putative hydrolase of the HAD superfamily
VTTAAELRGVIVDWGGVLTTPILTTVRAWIEADKIDWEIYRSVMKTWVSEAYIGGGPNPVYALERGECTPAQFEQQLAAQLLRVDGGAVVAEGLLQRMFAASVPVPAMYEMIRTLRTAGFSTALLSNSWGGGEYPRADFPALFDAVVISGEVGMRKPEPGIFLHAAEALGLDPRECAFVDDVAANVAAAAACGMTGVLHTEPAATAVALAGLFGVPLGAGPASASRASASQASASQASASPASASPARQPMP